MGRSATVKWIANDGSYEDIPSSTSAYFPYQHTIMLSRPENPRMAALIHEINECEAVAILKRLKMNLNIKLTASIIHRNKWIPFTHTMINDKIPISHIISPYACCSSCMTRKQYRVTW